MQRKKGPQNTLKEDALWVYQQVVMLPEEFAHDSALSKFFPPDVINEACYIMAGAFATVVYAPRLKPETMSGSALHMLYYLVVLSGFNIYVKEYALKNNFAPFTFNTDKGEIERIREEIFQKAARGELDATKLGEKVIERFFLHYKDSIYRSDLSLEGSNLNKTKFNQYVGTSLYWGYNFAREVVR